MIDVLLATYKAPKEHFKAQVDSILAQVGVEVNLLQREDTKGIGTCRNFAALLKESTAEYVAFSDQDDVWMEGKLAREMKLMREMEEKYGKETPILVFSDVRVVDDDFNYLDLSLFTRSKIDPKRIKPRQLVLQNVANGNTMLMNAALREKANPIPEGAFMHDHWVMLVAAVFGKIAYLNEPTLFYRQHKHNVLGGAKVDSKYFWHRFKQGRETLRKRLYANIRQAEAFAKRFGEKAPREILALQHLEERPWILRVMTLIRYRVFKNGLIRNLGTFAIV